MKRRDFFKGSVIAAAGAAVMQPAAAAGLWLPQGNEPRRRAKNIIFLVSDGMSSGTLAMADRLLERTYNKSTHWMNLYHTGRAVRGLMDTSSLNAIVTDSAASSSAWGGGKRVNNGSLNVNPDGSENKPIWQKMKAAGKKVGCVTTVPITHATPAGFCIASAKRDAQPEIAEMYKRLRFDVMMGGGDDYFNSARRQDKQDMYAAFRQSGFQVAVNLRQMLAVNNNKPVLGVFASQGLPYAIDRSSSSQLTESTPSLAEMTQKAIELMSNHKNGFCLQVEGGKVDWAAHANDAPALVYDQLAFDEAVGVAVKFAEADKNTLVIITTDHGNANPGAMYSSKNNFDNLAHFKQSNEFVLQKITPADTVATVRDCIKTYHGLEITNKEAAELLAYYKNTNEGGLYNTAKLPYSKLADIYRTYTQIHWASMDHSSDYVELAMMGPGSEMMQPFTRNTQLHNFMLNAVGITA